MIINHINTHKEQLLLYMFEMVWLVHLSAIFFPSRQKKTIVRKNEWKSMTARREQLHIFLKVFSTYFPININFNIFRAEIFPISIFVARFWWCSPWTLVHYYSYYLRYNLLPLWILHQVSGVSRKKYLKLWSLLI